MEKVGEILRVTRQEKGISLREVEEATKIRLRYLDALEKGNYDQIPGRVYALGFVRNYARYLGLDAQTLVQQFKEEYPSTEDNYQAEEAGLAPAGLSAGKKARWLLVPAVLLLLWGLNWVYNHYRPSLEPPAPPGTSEPAPVNPVPQAPVVPPPPPSPVEPPRTQGVEVKVKTSGDCWVGVAIDGKNDFNGTLKAGAEKVFQGKGKITVTLGNAGVAEVTINGQVQPALGKKGDVVTFEATQDSNQVRITRKP